MNILKLNGKTIIREEDLQEVKRQFVRHILSEGVMDGSKENKHLSHEFHSTVNHELEAVERLREINQYAQENIFKSKYDYNYTLELHQHINL